MSLKTKLTLMLSAFLVVIAVFAGGTMVIFEKFSHYLTSLRSASENTNRLSALDVSLGDFVEATRNWILTGKRSYIKEYHLKLKDVYKSFGDISKSKTQGESIREIGEEFQELLNYTKEAINIADPIGNPEALRLLGRIEALSLDMIRKIDQQQQNSINIALSVADAGNIMKRTLFNYHFYLMLVSSIMGILLVIRIKNTIAEPVSELLKATSKVSSGDLSYRIGMARQDEFGVVAQRFDEMVVQLDGSSQKLKKKLSETELFLDIARIASASLPIRDTLEVMAATICAKLKYDNCDIYLSDPAKNRFCLAASSDAEDMMEENCFPADNDAIRGICSMKPYVVNDTEGHEPPVFSSIRQFRSILALPILREKQCSGILVVRNAMPSEFSSDDINTLRIIVHTIDAAVNNAELFQATTKQLQRLTVLSELSKAVTSAGQLDELLQKTSAEIARLISSKGCIIRLLEKDILVIRSSFGLSGDLERKMALPLGEGIAGWVAQQGSPLLVEDAEKMPENMRVPMLQVRSVLCVPMKISDKVIGTIGLYDKYDTDEAIISFTSDDLSTVEGFASIASLAIERQRIHETELLRERKAREDQERLKILFDSVQGGIITLEKDFTISSVNRYIEDWLDMQAENLVGKSSIDVFHDAIGICPHCAAKATFETGEINTITQSRGVNYAELTSYPVRDKSGNISQCVVFIMDITERVLYQEETLNLYREVIQTKEYMESIIENSADAIVTSDLEGVITSWNTGAEKIFGFTSHEAIGTYLPFVPEFLTGHENDNIERIRKGEILRNVETLRRRKDGTVFEVSLSLSPIKDATGTIIGISGISRDISEKKHVEAELIRRNQELSRLFFISSAMRGTLELDKLLRMVLTAVTMSDGLGFNRAILFLVDDYGRVLKGEMGVGPASPEEAWKIWDELSLKQKSLDDIMQDIMTSPMKKDSFIDRLSVGIELSLEDDTILTRAVREKRPINVHNVADEPVSDAILIQQLGTQAYAAVPLVSRDKVIGLIWVDNFFNRKVITDEDMKFLSSFSNHVSSAIESARLFEKVAMAEQQLENIFESISDMVYFNSKDYVIKSVNKAVCSKIGKPAEEIIGRKCYEVFHGQNEPYKKCPHHKTVMTKKAYIEEVDDPYMGGTFLASSSPLFDSSGEFIGSVHVVRDITELRNLREKLATSQKMAALGEVAAKVAHEIRNPLVSVGGFAKRLEGKLDGNMKEYASIIVKEVERLEHILREILGFVKEVRLAREDVNLNGLLTDIFPLVSSDLEDRGITLITDFGSPPVVFVDPNRVREAFINILSNAVQSISGSGSVLIRTCESAGNAVVEITDSGRGITENDLQFIFNPFFTTKPTGTGLGLAITHKIIQEHNGWIEVRSEPGSGSTFKVYIPKKEEKDEDTHS